MGIIVMQKIYASVENLILIFTAWEQLPFQVYLTTVRISQSKQYQMAV
jgi:hypothetical protein